MSIKNKVKLILAPLLTLIILFTLTSSITLNSSTATENEDSYVEILRVGALFYNNSLTKHSCSGSIIKSSHNNLVLTAAHCINGSVNGIRFAPAYNGGVAPFGFWKVEKAFIPEQWEKDSDPKYDYAILKLSTNSKNKNVGEYTGGFIIKENYGGNVIVDVPGYNGGSNDGLINCTTKTFMKDEYIGFHCDNYRNGVSGSPMLFKVDGRYSIIGVIGGFEGGGNTTGTSYSSPLNMYVVGGLVEDAEK